jgi:RNA polymerase sigma-70 factor (ECF subfamily)
MFGLSLYLNRVVHRPRAFVARPQVICFTEGMSAPGKRESEVGAAAPAPGAAAEREQLEQVIRSHSAYVSRLAFRVLGRDDEVNDLVQDVFVAYLRFHATIREPQAVKGWLATTVIRMAHKRLRARRFRLKTWLGIDAEGQRPELPAPGVPSEDRTVFLSLHRALDRVPAKARIAWVLRYLEQEQLEDVARLCGCSLATTKRRIQLAHGVVQRALVP